MRAAHTKHVARSRSWATAHAVPVSPCPTQTYGVEPIDFGEVDDPAELIIDRTECRGVDASIDAVGRTVVLTPGRVTS